MGVRFECPAGHKLHVKAELAGKRGICPECGAKFIVPSFSGQRVAEDNGAATMSTVVVNSPAASTITPPPVPGAPPPPPAEPTAWYIRPASGGQFGPASDEVFAQWIAEARVSADSWVWRNGWADWKAGGDAIREFNSRSPVAPAPAISPIAADADDDLDDEPTIAVDLAPRPAAAVAAAPVELSPADQRRAEIKRRKQQVRNLSIALGIVALLMLVVLIFVLTRGSGEETPVEDEKPAAAAPAADSAPAAPAAEETPAEQPPAEAPKEEPAGE